MRVYSSGFTLTNLIFTILIIGILAAFSLPAYRSHVRDAKLKEAYSALLDNAQSLERFYQQNHSFKQNSTQWAKLAITQTDIFCLRPHGVARGATDGKFTLKAVAFDKENEPRILKINENLTAFICESSSSSCDTKEYFSGSDKNCSLYQP